MKHKLINQLALNGLIYSIILLAPQIGNAAAVVNLSFTPYLGIETGMQNFGFKAGYGDNVFNKQLPKGNLFVGAKFNEYLGLELGYETTTQGTKDVKIAYGAGKYLGNDSNKALGLMPGYVARVSSKTKISGWNIGVTGYYQVTNFNKLSAIGHVGIKNTKIKLSAIQYQVNNIPIPITTNQFRKIKFTLGLSYCSVGLQYALSEHVGIRTMLNWENTQQLKPITKCGKVTNQVKLKNSLNYTIGIIFI